MFKDKSEHNAFTLTELLVAIAIIAILIAVFIPSLFHFIEKAKLSTDRQMAGHMTQIMSWHFMDYPEDQQATLSAHDVRRVIDYYSEETISFTPRTPHAGFFYVDGTVPRIDVMRYDDAYQSFTKSNPASLLDFNSMTEPAQLFGNLLLTKEGSPVAEMVYTMHQRACEDLLQDTLDNHRRWTPFNPGIHQLLETMIDPNHADSFHPERIAYVTHSDWLLPSDDNVSRVLFMPGLSHIPAYYGNLTTIHQTTITIPASVKTIEGGAFTDELFDNVAVDYYGNVPLQIETNAFHAHHLEHLDYVWFDENTLIDVSHQLSYDANGVDLSKLSLDESLTAIMVEYKTHKDTNNIIIRLYTVSGLIGKAVLTQ